MISAIITRLNKKFRSPWNIVISPECREPILAQLEGVDEAVVLEL